MKVLRIMTILVVLWCAAGCGVTEAPQGSGLAAGGAIDEDFLMAYARHMAQMREHRGQVTPESVVEHFQNMEALIAEAGIQGMDQVSEFRQAVHRFATELLMRALQPELVPEIPRESVSDEEVRAFYEANLDLYTRPKRYAVSALTIRGAEQAEDLREAAARGALDMEEAALRYGLELETDESRPIDQFPSAWQAVLADMAVGQFSPLLTSADRQVIFRLDRIVPEQVQNFEQRKEFIRNDLIYARYRTAWQEAYQRLRQQHGIRIDPDVVERFQNRWRQEG